MLEAFNTAIDVVFDLLNWQIQTDKSRHRLLYTAG